MFGSTMKHTVVLATILLSAWTGFSQPRQPASYVQIKQSLDKLNTLGSVLYIAAHPDDENTRLISYMA
ncbi:MAG: hypothetical protein AAGB22_05850, partial [Bacteroidota bacterium]